MAANVRSAGVAALVDLFAGAGGLGLGAEEGRGELRLSVEIDPIACETLAMNQARVLEADVTKLTGRDLRMSSGLSAQDPLVLVGGAPCQPFSKAAYWTEAGDDAAYRRARASGVTGIKRPAPPTQPRQDGRRTLVEHFARLVLEARADAFVFENVPSIAHPRNRPLLDGLVQELGLASFRITVVRANATAYGVPQRRERVFVLGSKAGTPDPPAPTHRTKPGRPTPADAHLLPLATAEKACAPFRGDSFFEPEEVVRGRWAEHLKTVPPGSNYKAHTAWGGHPQPTFVTETRFWNFLLKLHPHRPSWTIAANPGPWTGPFHWDSRRLRVPELAELQGFPVGYKFAGTRRDKVRQIGNAVPPPLARHMIAAVLDTLALATRPSRRAS